MPDTLTVHAGHVKIYGREMCCEHCGQRELLAKSQRVTLLVKRLKGFVAAHGDCPARAQVSA